MKQYDELPEVPCSVSMVKNVTITALGAVYQSDNPQHFEQALKSVLAQTRPAEEIVLVIDGPIPSTLEVIVQHHAEVLKIVRLEENLGLGLALNCGLAACRGQFVARWDADDIQVENRFEHQIAFLEARKEVVVTGGLIAEFRNNIGDINQIRRVPLIHSDILKFAMYRSPVNHVTAMFDANYIKRIGGYRRVAFMEDYDLWLRVLESGGLIENIDTVLSHVRIGSGMVERRRGFKNIVSEIEILRSKKRMYGYSLPVLIWTAISISLRLMPVGILDVVYKKILRNK